ncbi:MAG: ABC transporter transmembrane domain-containing protein [Sulfurimonas sp.]|jgi:subfamily B ATP-binding cassette protein MsbA|uniref:ABC transporter ATP-binding protein n=1 Tax=unclassified Sulfurimonas TaxID=2623549 RepID=UPI0008D798DB|nr:ABC transporter transmembrane domain-containing protein [Sulfurimonas sp. RIFOXYB12_FULL_35_9]MBS4067926.1 ATP-binding cassette domain-containing protein [Sulfurimonas sp.]MDX9756410.1 ABC transporter transmembrane domain-containing protein [Sulfurimonas sp.]OHE05991.1 MAG: ABC transporter permease [Sulfurimonas sp. RIFOXYB12_FULL_35_9]OHE13241.1 MAG: ABC transporter permease [Sulfurimonas sp. RIFOXYB2_FULL_37_5]
MPYIKEYKLEYLLVFIGIVLTVSATTATAHIMKPLMDEMFIEKKEEMLYYIPLGLIGIYFFKSIGRYLQSVFMNYIGQHIMSRFREMLLEKIINLDMTFLYLNRSGELISRVTNDIDRIRYFVSNMLPELFRESLTVIALLGYVVYLNPVLAFYSLIVFPLAVYPILTIGKKLKKYSRRSQEKNADVVSRLSEVFNNSEIIKANATQKFEMERFSAQNWQFFKINMKSVYVGDIVSPMMEIVGAIGLAAVIFVGGREVYNGNMSVGEFTAFITAVGLVFQPIRRIGTIYSKIQDAVSASERVFEMLDVENKIIDGTKVLEDEIRHIEFKNVKLKYDDSYALDNINIEIKQGQKIALVGDSGGGKSTFINMLLRFYDPNEGEILINGTNIKEFTQDSLKHHISLVTQRIYIFQDTLAANVAYAQEIDEERVKEALLLADAMSFVESLEDGIHTKMEEFGSNLSGGQRQRIAIARAIYKHASLILFDEATSALDNESEKRIQAALDEYTKDKITITIAHRLSTIEHADKILVMQKGKITASGKHSELLESSEIYQRLAGHFKN